LVCVRRKLELDPARPRQLLTEPGMGYRFGRREGSVMSPPDNGPSSARTVVVAVVVNLAITLAKAVAAVMTGSAALWAETAHSVADTGNEILLFVGLRRSGRPADARHPFGYGQERWFWTFLAALGLFVVGGVLSISKGIDTIRHRPPVEAVAVGVVVLVVSFVLEAISWRTAHRQLRAEANARHRTLAQQLARGSDPTAATVFLEDTAALIGLGLALPALILHAVTGSALWDAGASIAIGALLGVVAVLMARRSKGLLIDESARPEVLDRLRERILAETWVGQVATVIAVFVGPGKLLVNARVVPTDAAGAGPAHELVELVAALRKDLLTAEAISDAEITVVPAADAY
jgi:cation diffusion facilitator family transporter